MNKKKLAIKIMSNISIPAIIIFIIAGCLVLFTVNQSIKKSTETELTIKSQSVSAEVKEFFTKYLAISSQLAANYTMENLVEETKKGETFSGKEGFEDVKKSLEKSAALDKENISAVWLAGFESSQIIQSDGYITPEGWDITQRPWYKILDTKETLLTAPYQDESSKELVVTVVAPVICIDDGEVIGAIGIDILLERVKTIVASYNLGETGKFLVIDSEKKVIYYEDSSIIQKNISDIGLSTNIVESIQNNQEKLLNYTYNGNKYYGYVSIMDNINWNVVSMLSSKEYNQTFYSVLFLIFSVFIVGIVAIIIIVGIVSATIVKPLKKLTMAAEQIADGNLDVIVEIKTEDEIGELGKAMTHTVSRLKEYIGYINEIDTVLNQIADGNLKFQLTYDYIGEFEKVKLAILNIQKKLTYIISNINEVSNQVSEKAEGIAIVAQSLADASTEQTSSVEKLYKSMNEVTDLTISNTKNAKVVESKAKDAEEFLQEGNNKLLNLTDTIMNINQTSEKIKKIVVTINDIAEQTNLLSLNASIEAARAGEAGKGFAVVANEVGTLANQSTDASKETEQLIYIILNLIQEGTIMAETTSTTMTEVLENEQEVSQLIRNISVAANEQDSAIQILKGEIEQIMSVVQNNTATSEESVAASEELASQADKLKELVKGFNI